MVTNLQLWSQICPWLPIDQPVHFRDHLGIRVYIQDALPQAKRNQHCCINWGCSVSTAHLTLKSGYGAMSQAIYHFKGQGQTHKLSKVDMDVETGNAMECGMHTQQRQQHTGQI